MSYKDNLIGDILGAYAQAFSFDKKEIDDVESDSKFEEISEGLAQLNSQKRPRFVLGLPGPKL